MSNEDIIKEIEKASKFVSEAARDVKVALCHSRNVVENENNEKAYNKGLEDVWKFLKAFCDMEVGEREEAFGGYTVNRLINMPPQEALAKLEAYEKEKEINVGDVVELADGTKAVVMDRFDDEIFALFTENGCVQNLNIKSNFKKTNKHIDITSVLEQLRGDKDENN